MKRKKLNEAQEFKRVEKIIKEAFDNVAEFVKKDMQSSTRKIQIKRS